MDAEFKKYVLDACISKKLKCKDAAKLLGMHPKSFSRLKRRYLQEGESALVRKKSGPRDFVPPNRTSSEIEQQVTDLACEHDGISIESLAGLLHDEYGIVLHPSTIWRILKRCAQADKKLEQADKSEQTVNDFYYTDTSAAVEVVSTSNTVTNTERVVTYSGLPHEPVEVSDE